MGAIQDLHVAHGGGFDESAGQGKSFFQDVATDADGHGGFGLAGQKFSDEIVGFVFDGDVGNAFEVLADTERVCFDISANTNAQVFEQLLRCVGPQRVLFGSDLPITRMRMRRIERDGHYVNLVPRGLYGDVSGDPNMREVSDEEARKLTFFLYEELAAFRRAAEAEGLTRADVEDVFHNNARRLLGAQAR